jgi:mannose-6-phosphate isomerase-like protein (cupin superfamily)
MSAWEVLDAISERKRHGERYYEFFRDRSLSLGIYGLSAGESDPQQPHTEDEVYYIVRGSGRMRIGDRDRAVTPGSVVFVGAGAEHRFHSIEEDLEVLVVFAPSEGSRA